MTTAPRPGEPAKDRGTDGGEPSRSGDAHQAPPEAGAEVQSQRVEDDLDALLADTRRERDEYLELAQRARADFDNYRKRAARDAREGERRGKATIARELVPALDNLERALRSAGVDPDAGPDPDGGGEPVSEEVTAQQALARGVALVLDELRAALERAGVETYDPVGQPFDPAEHEALAVRPAEGGAEGGMVIETLEKGYRLDGQVLRAARVVVSE